MLTTFYNNYEYWRLYSKTTFDGPNKIIYVNEGVTELKIKEDVYSEWKEWVKLENYYNAQYALAIRSIGGDPTVDGQQAGDIYFLTNGWKLYLDLTKVKVVGTLFSDNFNSSYFDFQGNLQNPVQVTNLVNIVKTNVGAEVSEIWDYNTRTLTSGDSPSAETVASAVWNKNTADHNTVGTFGKATADTDTNVLAMVGKILELWQLAGLDRDSQVDITDTSISFNGITISINQPNVNTTSLRRDLT